MRNTEKLVFGCFEVSSYVLIGLAIWQKSPLLGVIGAFFAAITVVWFLRLAKRVGIINPSASENPRTSCFLSLADNFHAHVGMIFSDVPVINSNDFNSL